MTSYIGQFVRREVELSGYHIRALRHAIVEVCVRIQIPAAVGTGEFNSVHPSLVIVEGLEYQRGAELPFVDKVAGLLVVGIDSYIESRGYLLRYPYVEVMITLDGWSAVASGSRCPCRV